MLKFKKITSLLGQVSIIVLMSFIFTEIVFRIYHKINPSFVFYDSSYNQFRGKPFAKDYDFNLNSKGFKDIEFRPEKELGIFRILGMGDSFAYGVVPYAYNYYTQLEEKLNKTERKVEIINLGIPSIGPKDYLALLLNEGLELNPELVILSFFLGNDLQPQDPRRSLYSYSYVASFIRSIIGLHKIYEGLTIHSEASYRDDRPGLEYETFLNIQKNRSNNFRNTDSFQNNFDNAIEFMREIKKICDYREIELLVILIPAEIQVNEQLRTEVIKKLNSVHNDFDFTLPNRLLAEEFASQNINYIDLLDDFRSASEEKRLYKPQDTHWNIAGNKLAAEIIYQHLSERWTNRDR